MTTIKVFATFTMLAIAGTAQAQQPPRPIDPGRSVTVSLAEYNRLIELAARPLPVPTIAPVAGVVSGADVRITVDRERARGVFVLSGDMLREGLGRIPLVASGAFVNATAQDRPVPLVADGNNLAAILNGPGPFSLSLDWGAPLAYASGRASFRLPSPKAGAVRTTIDLPGEQSDVHVSSGLITRRTITNGRTLVEATLNPGAATEVSWTTRESVQAATTREVKLLADVMTLVTVGESDVRMVALIDVSVLQGELRALTLGLPAGYELSGITGGTLDSAATAGNQATLTITTPASRSHQFLVSLERSFEGGELKIDTGLVRVEGAQRERGEVAIEGAGTLALSADEREGLQRIDVRELNPALQSLARLPLLSAFRYQGAAATARGVSVAGSRFADAGVAAAVVDHATATTLVTTEGRALTEITLHVRNRSQPFLKVALPQGAMIVSVLVGGESAKPAIGADGARVPLRRAGLTPGQPYDVSFVYLHAGVPFQRKGDIAMTLPKMDVPIGMMQWEVFVPERYSIRAIGGNAIATNTLRPEAWVGARLDDGEYGWDSGSVSGMAARIGGNLSSSRDVQAGAVLSPPAPPTPPATPMVAPAQMEMAMTPKEQAPPENVINVQKRAAGVLPIRIDVPKTGTSHQFVKPLVVDQETTVTLRYKRRS